MEAFTKLFLNRGCIDDLFSGLFFLHHVTILVDGFSLGFYKYYCHTLTDFVPCGTTEYPGSLAIEGNTDIWSTVNRIDAGSCINYVITRQHDLFL